MSCCYNSELIKTNRINKGVLDKNPTRHYI